MVIGFYRWHNTGHDRCILFVNTVSDRAVGLGRLQQSLCPGEGLRTAIDRHTQYVIELPEIRIEARHPAVVNRIEVPGFPAGLEQNPSDG